MGLPAAGPGYTRNTILLKGSLGCRHEEFPAAAALKPGHLLQLTSAGTVQKHASVGGKSRMFAKEQALSGGTIRDAFATGDIVPVHMAAVNDFLQGRVPAAAVAILEGDALVSNGDGTLIKASIGTVGNTVYRNTAASAAVTNTITETAFDKSYTFPVNTLAAGDIIRIRGQGIATATHSTDTLTIKVYIGGIAGTLIVSSGALDVADNDIFEFDITLIVRTAGASGTVVGTGWINIGTPGTATAKGFKLASTAIDTTATQQIAASATWSVADTGNSVRLDVITISQEKAGNVVAGSALIAYAAEAVDNSGGSDEAFIAVLVA